MPYSPFVFALAIIAVAIARCSADPTAIGTNTPPPLSQLISTNIPAWGETNTPLILAPTNSPLLSLTNPVPPQRGPKLASSSDLSPSFNLAPSQENSFPTRQPGIYLSSPYAMQVKVPDATDAGMTHSPSENWNLDNPVHNPGLELKKP